MENRDLTIKTKYEIFLKTVGKDFHSRLREIGYIYHGLIDSGTSHETISTDSSVITNTDSSIITNTDLSVITNTNSSVITNNSVNNISLKDFVRIITSPECIEKDKLLEQLKKVYKNHITNDNLVKLLKMGKNGMEAGEISESQRLLPLNEDGSISVNDFIEFLYK